MEQYPLHLNRILKTWGGVSGKERIKINFSSSTCRRAAMDVNFMQNQRVKKIIHESYNFYICLRFNML